MKSPTALDRVAPRRQANWDWRAAGNFIAGGAGGGLLSCAGLLAFFTGSDVRVLLVAGLMLIGIGLTCVWFEIGRPWRAMNVFRHFGTSWMTREAYVAMLAMGVGALAICIASSSAAIGTGLLGLMFIYAQARILAANKGIPAWRHTRCRQVVVSTGLAEGAALATIATMLDTWWRYPAAMLALFLVWRWLAWRGYLAALIVGDAPVGTIRALRRIAFPFEWGGSLVPVALLVVALVAGVPALATIAALLALVAGGWLKYTLICSAAFTQGFALPKQPVRGAGQAGPAIKPGWGGA